MEGTEGIPRSVLKQGANADRLFNEMAEGKPLNLDQPKEDKPVNEVIEGKDKEKPPVKSDEVIEKPVEKEAPPSEKKEEVTNKDKLLAQADQRNKTLQGMVDKMKKDFEAQIESLRTENRAKDSTIQNLNSILANRSAASAIDETDEQNRDNRTYGQDNTTGLKRLNPADFEGYGDEMTDFVNGFNSLMEENKKLRESLDNVTTVVESSEQRTFNADVVKFEAKMDDLVPNWREINRDVLFYQTYLDEHPAYRAALDNAAGNLNAKDAASIFNLFIRDTGYVDNGGSQEEKPESEYNLNDEVVPDDGGSGEPLVKDSFTPVTSQEFAKASRDHAMVLANGNAAAIEKSSKKFDRISLNYQRSIREGKV